jgi:hypothetical protein
MSAFKSGLKLIIKQIMITATCTTGDARTFSRWLRSAYRLCTERPNCDYAKADAVLAQALHLAQKYPPLSRPGIAITSLLKHTREISVEEKTTEYPPDEIEWLATTTFNRAVDAYIADDDGTCQRLADLAIEFAKCLESHDEGNLRSALEERKKALQSMAADEGEEGEFEMVDADEITNERVLSSMERDNVEIGESNSSGKNDVARATAEEEEAAARPEDDSRVQAEGDGEDDGAESAEEDDCGVAYADAERREAEQYELQHAGSLSR